MIVYIVKIHKYSVTKKEVSRRTYPLDVPELGKEIIVNVDEAFPNAFNFWPVYRNSFENKTKSYPFKTIRTMIDFFEERKINIGTTRFSFYKIKKSVPEETPIEGVLIYSYDNIEIFASRL